MPGIIVARLLVVIRLKKGWEYHAKWGRTFRCEVGPKVGAMEQFFDLGLTKTKDLHGRYIILP